MRTERKKCKLLFKVAVYEQLKKGLNDDEEKKEASGESLLKMRYFNTVVENGTV